MALATPGPTPPSSWCPSGLCGLCCREWGKTATHEHARVHHCQQPKVRQHVNAPREFQPPVSMFLSCTLTWWGRCLSLLATSTVSLPSTDTPVGLRHSLCLTSPPKQLLKPSSASGLLISAVPSKSQQTRAGNSRPAFSRLWLPSPDPL